MRKSVNTKPTYTHEQFYSFMSICCHLLAVPDNCMHNTFCNQELISKDISPSSVQFYVLGILLNEVKKILPKGTLVSASPASRT